MPDISYIPTGRDWAVPKEVYNTIETLLPTGKGLFCELWAARGRRRPGWTHVAEIREPDG